MHPTSPPLRARDRCSPPLLPLQQHHQSPRGSNLSRRWSLDNLSATEGYIRDLRRQHQHQHHLSSIRDEEYPLTLTEQEQLEEGGGAAKGGAGCAATISSVPAGCSTSRHLFHSKGPPSSRLFGLRNRSGSVDYSMPPSSPVSKMHSPIKVSSYMYFSSSVDISVVPEDNEVPTPPPAVAVADPVAPTKSKSAASTPAAAPPPSLSGQSPKPFLETKLGGTKAFLRQRSSSLPRILPPILDTDADHEGAQVPISALESAQQDRQSSIVIREMQKFVCRQATDVSHLLPLPIPSNTRMQAAAAAASAAASSSSPSSPSAAGVATSNGCNSKTSRDDPPERRKAKSRLVMTTIAKVHGIMFAVKQTTPTLFSDMITALNLNGDVSARHLQQEEEMSRVASALLRERSLSLEESKLRRHWKSMTSTSALPCSIIVHGNLRPSTVVFKYSSGGGSDATGAAAAAANPTGVRLPCLHQAFLGTPLLDLYSYVYDEVSIAGVEDVAESLPELLREYHGSFNRTVALLRVSTCSLTLRQLMEDFVEFLPAGILMIASKTTTATCNSPSSPSPQLPSTCISILKDLELLCQHLTIYIGKKN